MCNMQYVIHDVRCAMSHVPGNCVALASLCGVAQFANYPSPWAVYSAISTDALFICPARRTARWATAAGLNAYVCVDAGA